MKYKYLLLIWGLLIAAKGFTQNPFITDQFTADPTARVFNGRVYVYASHDIPSPVERLKEWFCMEDYHVFSSDNLTDWTDHGVIVSQNTVPWVKPLSYSMWAPDCVSRNGKYYFYFPSMSKDTISDKGFSIGVAVSDSPSGGFVPQKKPIEGVKGIDPCVFIDKDNQAYIYWCGGGMFAAKLKDNMVELDSAPMSIDSLPEGFKEGPFVFERNGIYYYTFPWVQDKTETLAYAMGKSPLGPFEFKGLIMDQWPSECWTNHHSVVSFKDQWYLFYHHNDFSPEFDKNRSARIDSLFFNRDGTIQKVKPTFRGVGITDASAEIQIDRYSNISDRGISIEFIDNKNKFNGWKTVFNETGCWVQYNSIDFGRQEKKRVKIKAISGSGGILEIRAKNKNGAVISEIMVPESEKWTILNAPVEGNNLGVENIFISLKDGKNVEVDWLSFE